MDAEAAVLIELISWDQIESNARSYVGDIIPAWMNMPNVSNLNLAEVYVHHIVP